MSAGGAGDGCAVDAVEDGDVDDMHGTGVCFARDTPCVLDGRTNDQLVVMPLNADAKYS